MLVILFDDICSVEYLQLCEEYPVWQLKSVRSHCMKYLYRYLTVHTDLRTELAMANSIEAILGICKVKLSVCL